MTSNSHFLAVSAEDSSLQLYCSLSADLGGTLSWPTASRIFLRESPWTKKSVFSFLWKLWCSLWKQRNLDSVQEKCILQTNSLGKSLPPPPCLGQAQGVPHHFMLSSWRPPPFSSHVLCLWLPKGHCGLSLPLPCCSGPKSLQVSLLYLECSFPSCLQAFNHSLPSSSNISLLVLISLYG